jgi:hypothetical protein
MGRSKPAHREYALSEERSEAGYWVTSTRRFRTANKGARKSALSFLVPPTLIFDKIEYPKGAHMNKNLTDN